ncbi:hypothetical protein SFRURICE_002795 [Spodoptera frugiperda]|nr:hypothetical protein SFRURICE_002795 [Spodoptera frugiperda]
METRERARAPVTRAAPGQTPRCRRPPRPRSDLLQNNDRLYEKARYHDATRATGGTYGGGARSGGARAAGARRARPSAAQSSARPAPGSAPPSRASRQRSTWRLSWRSSLPENSASASRNSRRGGGPLPPPGASSAAKAMPARCSAVSASRFFTASSPNITENRLASSCNTRDGPPSCTGRRSTDCSSLLMRVVTSCNISNISGICRCGVVPACFCNMSLNNACMANSIVSAQLSLLISRALLSVALIISP